MDTNTNKNEVLVALLSGINTAEVVKEAKASLPQSSAFEGVVTLRVPFTMTKGEDTDAKPTASILSLEVLAKALAYAGVTSKSIKESLRRSATEALLSGDKVGVVLSEEDKRIVAVIKEIQDEVVAKLPRQPRTGMVKVMATPEVISTVIERKK